MTETEMTKMIARVPGRVRGALEKGRRIEIDVDRDLGTDVLAQGDGKISERRGSHSEGPWANSVESPFCGPRMDILAV